MACLVALAGVAGAAASSAGVFNPQTFRLGNGLEVVVIPSPRAPVVTQMLWYRVGAADEPAGKSGIAHFLEHLMFKGTRDVPPGEFSRRVARVGGRDNAFTGQDFTAYFQSVASDQLEYVMKLESDRMANLVLTDAVVLPERDVVLEERRQRTENDPRALLAEQAGATLFLHHPYGIPIIGWKHELEKLTTADALDFYRHYYHPGNAILIIAGDVTVEQVRGLAEKYYGAIPAHPVAERQRVSEPPQLAARRVVMRDARVREPAWTRQYVVPGRRLGGAAQADALEVLAEILGGGTTARLPRQLVNEEKIALAAGSYYDADVYDYGRFAIFASPRTGTTVEAIEARVDAEIARLLEKGVTEDEVTRAKSRLATQAVFARDSMMAGARAIGAALTTGQSIDDVETWPDRIRAVTAEQVNAAIRAVFDIRRSVTSVLLPEGSG